MIACLYPDREVYAGRKFFTKLLELKGVDGVLDFIERSKEALLTQDGLDLHYNFDVVEKEVFKRTYLKFWSKREFLNTFGWGMPGALFTAYGLAGVSEQAEQLVRRESLVPEGWDGKRPAAKIKEAILVGEPAAEVLIGAALVNEAFEKWSEIKLEQIADAVDVLGKKLQIQTKRAGATLP